MNSSFLFKGFFSLKKSIEVGKNLNRRYRNKKLSELELFLKDVLEKKKPITFFSSNRGVAHRKIHGPGGYPQKIIKELLSKFKGIDKNSLFVAFESGVDSRQKKPIIKAHSNINFLNKIKVWIKISYTKTE